MDDLISRAAAIEAIVGLTAFESEDELKKFVKEKACDDYYLGGLCDAIDEIKDTTAVDAAPVVHGRWVKMTGMMPPEYHGHYCCSECGWHMKGLRNSWTREEELPNCPNCRANMRMDNYEKK